MREGVIAQLRRHLNAVVSKRPGLALGLWGEPGVGKTFTVQALLRETPCKSLSLLATLPEQTLVAALPGSEDLPDWAGRVLERVRQGQAMNPQTLADAVAAVLSERAPFVLHLEDIHEADAERLEQIQKLAQAVSRLRGVGLLVTSRSEPPEPFKSYRLEPLDQPTLSGLLEAQAKGALPREALEWMYARTQGNPLFSLEFWRYLSRQGFLWSDGQEWHWRTPDKDFVPASVEGLIAQVIAGSADADSRAVLEARAIFPSSFSSAVLEPLWAEVAGVDAETLLEVRKGLEARGVFAGDRFVHPLFGEVVWRETPPEQRQAYARRAIAVLEADQPEQAAEFLEGSGLEGEPVIALLERAAQALEHADPTQAIRMAEIAASGTPPDPEAVLLLAGLLAIHGHVAEAEARLGLLPQSETVALRWWETQIKVATQGGHTELA